MSKNVLILERSSNPIDLKIGKDGNYILEGVFTEIGVRNKNNRIYEESEFVPHVNLLQDKIKTSRLLGELDHPTGYEVSLKNVSHVVEKLHYDSVKKQVIGRIKILDTSNGKEVKALIDSGIPIHISSRAAGIVESNGKVKLKQLFTYDIVADPGFENAQLVRLNESLGFEDNDLIQIYDINENIPMLDQKNISEFATVPMIDGYSKEIIKEMKRIENKIEQHKGSDDSKLNETVKKLIAHNNYLAEKLEQVIEYTEKEIGGKLEKSIKYSDYLGEKMNQSIKHSDHIVEEFNRFEDSFGKYTTYIAENMNQRNSYSDYLAEQLEKNIQYSEYIKENVEKTHSYLDYLSENLNENFGKSPNGKKDLLVNGEDLDSKLTNLLESVKNEVTEKAVKFNFLKFISESQRNNFNRIDESSRQKVINGFEVSKFISPAQAQVLYESFLRNATIPLWEANMPEKYKTIWQSLNESQKDVIKGQASLRTLDKPHQIDYFWSNIVNLREFERKNSGLTYNNHLNESSQNTTQKTNFVSEVEAELKRRLTGRY